MLRNYLKVAFRNLLKNRVYVLINVLGMGIAISFCLTIYLALAYNLEFDNYYKDTSDIYRVHEFKQHASGEIQRFELAPYPMGPRVPEEIAGVKEQTRYTLWYENIKINDEIFGERIAYVDTGFFNLFPIGLVSGSHSSIHDKNSILLTQKLAEKLFNNDPPLGRTLTLYYPDDRQINFTVAGVFEKVPFNSSFEFGAMVRFDNFLDGHNLKPDDWTAWQQTSMYIRLEKGADPRKIEEQFKTYVSIQNDAREEWKISDFDLVEFKDASLVNQGEISGSNSNFRIREEILIVFGSMALLILLIACFNLANTSISLMAKRVREIGVRKVMGGGTRQIFFQFMLEMAFTSFFALLLGLALFRIVSDGFYTLWDAPIHNASFSMINMSIAILFLFFLATLMAGIYPAIYSNRFQPAVIFRNKIKLKNAGLVSKILNGLQFVFSISVLIAGIVYTRNTDFIKSLDYGYDHQGLIVLNLQNEKEYSQMRDQVLTYSGISGFAGTQNHFNYSYEDTYLTLDSGKVEIRSLNVGPEYLQLMNMKLIEGRFFERDRESDYTEGVIVNQEYVNRFKPEPVIGSLVRLGEENRYIVGVVGNVIDYVWSDNRIIPKLYIPVEENEFSVLMVKSEQGKQEKVFADLQASWKEIIPDRPFSGRYQDDVAFGNALRDNSNMKTIFLSLAILGSILSLTGIFALSSLNVSSRFKEIGIRKVMGATSGNIMVQMNRGFLWVMLIATLIGGVAGYLITDSVLKVMYTYHISIGITTLVWSGFSILAVALLTTSITIRSAANTNPAHILRDE